MLLNANLFILKYITKILYHLNVGLLDPRAISEWDSPPPPSSQGYYCPMLRPIPSKHQTLNNNKGIFYAHVYRYYFLMKHMLSQLHPIFSLY